MMSWLRPHGKVVLGVLGRQAAKRQSILVYRSGRSTRGSDPKSVKQERAGETGSRGDKRHRGGHKGLVRPLAQGAIRQMGLLQYHFRHCC